jgi:hypothetical protein
MQCTIAVSALEALYQQQSMKKKDMVDKIYNIFHGCEQTRTASFADMAFQGQSQFKVLYDFGEIRPNAANNEDRSSGVQLSLKSSLTRQPNRNFVTDTDIKLSHILQATLSAPTLITGHTFSYAADMALKNCKKALAASDTLLDGNGNLPSGTTEEDNDDHVLNPMYKLLHGMTIVVDGDEDEDDDTGDAAVVDAVQRPHDWFFKGRWAFKAFGPLAVGRQQSILFKYGGFDNWPSKEQGRTAARTKQKQSRNEDRSADLATSPFKRGMTISHAPRYFTETTAPLLFFSNNSKSTSLKTFPSRMPLANLSKRIRVLSFHLAGCPAVVLRTRRR